MESSSAQAASQQWKSHSALRSGSFLAAPGPRGATAGTPQRSRVSQMSSGAAAFMHSGFVCAEPGTHPCHHRGLFTQRCCFQQGAGQSIPSSGCCLPSEQSITMARPSSPVLPWLFPGELSSRAADLARNCCSPLQQEI